MVSLVNYQCIPFPILASCADKVHLIVMQIWVPTNPRGAERLPPGIIESESDYYLRRLWGHPREVCILTAP